MTSDNGTNFVCAVNELKEFVSQVDKDKIQAALVKVVSDGNSSRGCSPVFFGGVFETMAKSAKKALYAV